MVVGCFSFGLILAVLFFCGINSIKKQQKVDKIGYELGWQKYHICG
jgi:hypothetical protein